MLVSKHQISNSQDWINKRIYVHCLLSSTGGLERGSMIVTRTMTETDVIYFIFEICIICIIMDMDLSTPNWASVWNRCYES